MLMFYYQYDIKNNKGFFHLKLDCQFIVNGKGIWGLVLTSAIVATKNVDRAISRCLFTELISTFFGDLYFGRNNDQARYLGSAISDE